MLCNPSFVDPFLSLIFFLFRTTTPPSFTFSISHFFSGQNWRLSSSLIVLYLWVGARKPTSWCINLEERSEGSPHRIHLFYIHNWIRFLCDNFKMLVLELSLSVCLAVCLSVCLSVQRCGACLRGSKTCKK
jgi:hypothetical protein